MTSMLSGSRPSIASASAPTALTRLSLVESATTEGSESTMPRPLTYTSTLAVPRSIPIFRIPTPIYDSEPTVEDYMASDRKLQIANRKYLLAPIAAQLRDLEADHCFPQLSLSQCELLVALALRDAFLGVPASRFGPRLVDLVGTLGGVGKNGHAVGQHFH